MDLKQKAFLFAICSAAILAGCKFTAGFFSGSMAILSSGLDSFLDVSMSAMNLWAIRKASQPADQDHRYGHGKAENLAAIFQTLVIVFSGSYIIITSIHKWIEFKKINYSVLDLGAMILSLSFSFFISRHLKKTGEATGSQALKADALHYTSDLYSNTAALLAILLTYFTGKIFFDLFFAVIVGAIIIYSAVIIAKNALVGLMDSSIPQATEEKLITILESMPFPYAGFHKLRTRTSGSKIYGDLHVLFCRMLKVDEAHERTAELESEIARTIPSMDIIIHIEPCEETCENTVESCKIRKPKKN
ncbi:MAG: cation diffusion facilitator family transporter [Thermodesulfobacteriota bacterium]|jgi:cation diffusion facilitator family transporter